MMTPDQYHTIVTQLAVLASEVAFVKMWLGGLTTSIVIVAVSAVGALLVRNGKR